MKYSRTVRPGTRGAGWRERKQASDFAATQDTMSNITSAKIQECRHLLREGKMTIAFQPIWNLAQGRVLAFEALARPAAHYGFAGPQEMFDLAERLGRAHELDALCVRAILARAAELPNDTMLFMNLTPQTLVHDLLTGTALLEEVVSAGLAPSRVVLEITERSNVGLEEIARQVNFLRLLGFQIAIDDMGEWRADLEMLAQISADFVKIDRSVLKRAFTEDAAYNLILAIATLARESGTAVVTEGIENPEMLTLVQQFKGQYGQGYMLGRPSETIADVNTLPHFIPFSVPLPP